MQPPRPVVIDFETYGIEGRPHYPPKPVGVSIKYPDQPAKYYAWGHLSDNNCNIVQARKALVEAYKWEDGILFQNAKFDIDVAETHLDIKPPYWDLIHDTMYLLFLDDPHQLELGLKPSAQRLLNLPPEEQDAVGDWLVKNQPVEGVKISSAKSSKHYFGRYIAYAPGDLVAKYANGDVERTEQIFNLLYTKTEKRGMLEAYDRERRLMPIMLEMERQGLPIDLELLRHDVKLYTKVYDSLDKWVRITLNIDEDVNLDSGSQLIGAMVAAGKADSELLPLTPTGKFQTNKEALLLGVTDKTLLAVLKYRTQLGTCLSTFMEPWLKVAEDSGGLIYTNWNQIKSPKGKDSIGTRTGRLSSTPNFQNIPKSFEPIFMHESECPEYADNLPLCPLGKIPPLPIVRSYIIPFEGEVFIDRDYSQQEPRILAHFENGKLMQKYIDQPWIDFHDYAKAELAKMGKFYDRKPVKNTNLGLIYGMGVGKLAEKNNMTVEEAKELKNGILSLYPGLSEMYQDMKSRARNNIPVRTWGGREYYCEPAKYEGGKIREFDYKMVNILIQGSAADCTKEAIIRYHDMKDPRAKIVLNVHDQITVSVPTEIMESEMEVLRQCMEGIEFDVPMLSEGSIGHLNWDELEDYDKKGVRV